MEQMVQRKSAIRRKHPHFTNSELDLIRCFACMMSAPGSREADYARIHYKAEAALRARGVIPKRAHSAGTDPK